MLAEGRAGADVTLVGVGGAARVEAEEEDDDDDDGGGGGRVGREIGLVGIGVAFSTSLVFSLIWFGICLLGEED